MLESNLALAFVHFMIGLASCALTDIMPSKISRNPRRRWLMIIFFIVLLNVIFYTLERV